MTFRTQKDHFNQIRDLLETSYLIYNNTDFIPSDPVSIPHLFSKKEDIEIAGFFASTLAWGQRKTTIHNARNLMKWMDDTPHDFIMNFTDPDLNTFRKFVHRTFNGIDCEYFMWALKNIYQNYNTLENAFTEGADTSETDTGKAINRFRLRFFGISHEQRTEKHIGNPLKNASCKRINMFLRWMVRKDEHGVDFGLWNRISPSQLVCPLDVHSGNVARKLGLLNRNMNDWKAAMELTNRLRYFDPVDPVKYDYALFGIGISGNKGINDLRFTKF